MKNHNILAVMTLFFVALMVLSCAPAQAPATSAPAEQPTPAQPPATPIPSPAPGGKGPVPVPPADGSRPLAQLPPAERADRFSGPAPMSVDPNTIYIATIVTAKGNIVAELYPDTPESVNNFVTLAKNGFYDGLTFHRVEPGFVIQGGDPAGTGAGNPGYTIPAEIKHNHPRGALAWARTSDEVNPERRSSGSQFYITLEATPFLDGAYTVFGYVIEGMEVADQIAAGDVIERIDISTAQTSLLPTPTLTPLPKAPVLEEGRPLARLSLADRQNLYNTAPATLIDPAKSYQATIETDEAKIVIDLDAETAPATVSNFILLANLGFYDGMPLAYLETGSYAVLGSPASRPDSDVGYALDLEPAANAKQVITGTVSMYPVQDLSTSAVKASGSQFFISFVLAPDSGVPLNIFGQVTSGLEDLAKLAAGDIVRSITISEK